MKTLEGELLPVYNTVIDKPFGVTELMEDRRKRGKQNPIEVMLDCMDQAKEADNQKAAVAIAALVAPYIHAKLASITVTTEPVPPSRIALSRADDLKLLVRGYKKVEEKS